MTGQDATAEGVEWCSGREAPPDPEPEVVHTCPKDGYCDTCDPAGLNTYNLGGW